MIYHIQVGCRYQLHPTCLQGNVYSLEVLAEVYEKVAEQAKETIEGAMVRSIAGPERVKERLSKIKPEQVDPRPQFILVDYLLKGVIYRITSLQIVSDENPVFYPLYCTKACLVIRKLDKSKNTLIKIIT